MLICTVVGSVVSTRKNEKLVGNKLLIVEPSDGSRFVAIDDIGAGIGERVLVALGSAARNTRMGKDAPVDAAIVGIIDGD